MIKIKIKIKTSQQMVWIVLLLRYTFTPHISFFHWGNFKVVFWRFCKYVKIPIPKNIPKIIWINHKQKLWNTYIYLLSFLCFSNILKRILLWKLGRPQEQLLLLDKDNSECTGFVLLSNRMQLLLASISTSCRAGLVRYYCVTKFIQILTVDVDVLTSFGCL